MKKIINNKRFTSKIDFLFFAMVLLLLSTSIQAFANNEHPPTITNRTTINIIKNAEKLTFDDNQLNVEAGSLMEFEINNDYLQAINGVNILVSILDNNGKTQVQNKFIESLKDGDSKVLSFVVPSLVNCSEGSIIVEIFYDELLEESTEELVEETLNFVYSYKASCEVEEQKEPKQ